MRITIDTAILVRTNTRATGPARRLLDVIQQCGSVLVLSPFLLQEVERVLGYARIRSIYQLSDDEIRQHVEFLRSIAEIVIPAEGPCVVLKDANDDPVIYTAVAGGADVICTVDQHFYGPDVLAFCSRQGIQVMTEVELLHALRTQ